MQRYTFSCYVTLNSVASRHVRLCDVQVRRQVRPILLRKRDVPAVLLRAVLGVHPQPAGQGVPQATRQGGG